MHVQSRNSQPVGIGAAKTVLQVGVPDAVLRLFTAGVGFLTVAVAETRVDAQRNVMARGALAQLIDHVGRAAVGVNAELDDHFERGFVEDVGSVHHRRRRIGIGAVRENPAVKAR